MDLEHFIGNRELLGRLSREYELLKASGANVDYAAWVRQRLREAATELSAAPVGTSARSGDIPASDSYGILAGGAPTVNTNTQSAFSDTATAGTLATRPAEQLAFTRHPGPPAAPVPGAHPILHGASVGQARPEMAWFLRGEGTGPASGALASAIYGPSAQCPEMPAPTQVRSGKATRNKAPKRVVIISPRKSPLKPQQHPSPKRQEDQQRPSAPAAPPVSKLYTQVEPGLFSARPDAYVHPQARPRRPQSAAAMRPDWVNAASLQAALRGASSAIPHMQAAAERERRLALSIALARQTLAAGLDQDQARAMALYGMVPTGATAQAAQYDHVLQVAQQLAQQNEQLAMAVQLNSAQLAEQQALLESAMQQEFQQQQLGSAAPLEGGAAAMGPAAADVRVEVESGPPGWFTRRGPRGLVAPSKQGKGFRLAAKGSHDHAMTTTSAAKTPKKVTTCSRSPAMKGNTGIATLPSSAAAIVMTAKERERSSRKDALKALLKQVLGSAGLADGKEGRRRLASSMAEAEKLVAAIHALARTKAGADGIGAEEQTTKTLPVARALAVAETQTSARASGAGAEREAALVVTALGQAKTSGQPSRAASLADSRSTASAANAAGTGAAPGVGSRPLSRQGSGLASESAACEPQFAAGAEGEATAGEVPSLGAPSRTESLGAFEEPLDDGVASKATSKQSLPMPVSVPGSVKDGLLPSTTTSSSSAREVSSHTASVGLSAARRRGRIAIGPDSVTQAQAQALPAAATAPSATTGSPSGAAATRMQVPSRPLKPAVVTAGGAAPRVLLPQGVIPESLEDQVQQIVERDAAVAAEMARVQKLDALEARLYSMMDRVETKLARVLQPLHLNTQELQPQQAGPQGHLRTPPTATRVGKQGYAGAAAGEVSLSAVAAAVAAAAAGAGAEARAGEGTGLGSSRNTVLSGSQVAAQDGAGVISGVGSSGGGRVYATGVDTMSPRSTGMSVLELQRMLIELNRMESKEQEIRRKWFFDAKAAHRQRGRVVQPIVVRDGQLGALDPEDPTAALLPSLDPPSGRVTGPPLTVWSMPQPPTESAVATIAADTAHSAVSVPGAGLSPIVAARGCNTSSVQVQDGTAGADEALADPISDKTLESVLRGRRRFLRTQKLADGDVMVAAQPSLSPVQIMEDLTDALLDELLEEQAQDLAGLCDSLGEHMFMDEFGFSEDDT